MPVKNVAKALLFAAPLGLLVILIFLRHRGEDDEPRGHERIDAFVAALRKESLEDSIDRLIDVRENNQWLYPGYSGPSPLSQTDLEEMLSSRRSLKVLDAIEKLPASERDARCKRLFTKALQALTNGFELVFKHEADPSFPFEPQPLGGSKMAICLAMFIEADTGQIRLLAEQFSELDEFRGRAHTLAVSSRAAHPKSALHLLERVAVPDDRFQVNILHLAAVRVPGNSNTIHRIQAEYDRAMRTETLRIVAWDARTTWFEVAFGHQPPASLDTKRGFRDLDVLYWKVEDDEFPSKPQQQVASNLRSIVLVTR